jgi:hypothetical protein
MRMAHNKALLAQAAPAGTAYCVVRPKARRYAVGEQIK